MTRIVIKAIENVRKRLHKAANSAGYDFQSEEVQILNARLDKIICRYMKKVKNERIPVEN